MQVSVAARRLSYEVYQVATGAISAGAVFRLLLSSVGKPPSLGEGDLVEDV